MTATTSDGGTGTRVPVAARPPAWTHAGVAWGILGVVLVSRLALLGHGYGGDPDAWRAISAAQHLLDTGTYVPSRVPGYPLPEYVDALLLYLGVGSSLVIGLVSALLSGVSAALFFTLLSPLGRTRAVAGALALAFTPVVYVASLGAMDYLWGLTFFLAATSCMLSRRIWWAAILLGLAAASRPSYALGIVPLVLLYVDFEPRRLRDRAGWRPLAVLTVCSGLIALAFFVPAFLAVGFQTPKVYGDWKYLLYNVSLGLFGVVGVLGVTLAVVSAWFNRRRGVALPNPLGRVLDRWAVTVVVMFGLLFVWLPDEASYLIPALLGGYWLLCRYSPQVTLWVLTASLLVSCFVFSVERHQGALQFTTSGPVLRDIDAQEERSCVAAVVKHQLATSSDYVIAGAYRPQLLVEVGMPLAQRILYTVRPDSGGGLVDAEGVLIPADARLLLLDRVADQQSEEWQMAGARASVLDSHGACPDSA